MIPAATSSVKDPATLLIETPERLDVHRVVGDATIGRDKGCGVVVEHPTVSRSHARIYRTLSGWHIQDLGSQNGSRLGAVAAQVAGPLKDGSELRIGRVRAWFFAGQVPADWTPPEGPKLGGKLIRCPCGNMGWAPSIRGAGQLRCSACGREFERRELPTAQPPQPPPSVRVAASVEESITDCAACHTSIEANETMHTCPGCEATMHEVCWRENRGCATYGCPQVGALDVESDDVEDAAIANHVEGETPPRRTLISVHDSFKQSLMAVIVFAGVGLPMFGVPAFGYAAYQMFIVDRTLEGRGRFIWATISLIAGVIGLACSAHWWLGYDVPLFRT